MRISDWSSDVCSSDLQNVPSRPIITKVGGRDEAVEANMLAEAETVGDMAEIALELGLAGEMLGPVPFGEELWREGVGVGIAFRVEPGSGITIPPPDADDIGASFQQQHAHLALQKPVKRIESREQGPNENRIIVEWGKLRPGRLACNQPHIHILTAQDRMLPASN